MSTPTRLALSSALASLLVACSLLPLATPTTWLFQAVPLIALQAAAAGLCRRAPLARPLTVIVQLVVVALALTLVFASEDAVLGFLPGPAALTELGELVRAGLDDVGRYQTPAPVTRGIRLLLVGGVVLIAVVVDALAVTYRNAAPAGLPLLALYSVAAGLSTSGVHWAWFLLAAAGYLLLLLTESKDRLSRWGRVFSGAPHRGDVSGAGEGDTHSLAPGRTGRRIGAASLGIALVLPTVLPSLGDGLVGPNASGSRPGGSDENTITAVNPLVSLQDSLNQPQDREVLNYRTTSRQNSDIYLRIVALDQFDGTEWRPSQRRVKELGDPLPRPPGLSDAVKTDEVRTSVIAAQGYRQNWLPLPYPITSVRITGDWRFEPAGRTLVGDNGQTTSGMRYQVNSLRVQPTAKQLAQAPKASRELITEYTTLPDSLPGVVASQAVRVTQDASNDFERAVALQDWFSRSGKFAYDTEVNVGTGVRAIERFLRTREGFCVHFAFTMAAMSRSLGIPARVAVGYVPGTAQPDGSWSVGIKDAHAWPELYFEGVGWTRFEPTPSRGSTPRYAQPEFPSEETEEEESATRTPERPDPVPSRTTGCDARSERLGDCSTQDKAPVGRPPDDPFLTGPRVMGVATAFTMLLLPVLPLLWRSRVRKKRLRIVSHGESADGDKTTETDGDRTPGILLEAPVSTERILALTLPAWQEFLDTAWDYGTVPDDSETPRRAVERVIGECRLEGEAEQAARRLAWAVEQVRYAPEPRRVPELAADVQTVIAALATTSGRRGRLRALLLPRSGARGLRAVVVRLLTGYDGCTAAVRQARQRVTAPIHRLRQRPTGR